MLYINKNQFTESIAIETILEENIVQVRRNETRKSNGQKETKLSPSAKVCKVVRNLLDIIIQTGVNELCCPKENLTTLLKCDSKHTNDYIKDYFKGYGIGEYSYSNKYKISVNGKDEKYFKRGTHYYLYFNKETLELIRDNMNIEGLDFDDLIDQIPDCENKRQIIGNKTETEITVTNYIDNDFIVKHVINVEKNLFTKEGHYSKETKIMDLEDRSVVSVKKKENDFIPKECNKSSIEEKLEEVIESIPEVNIEEPTKEEAVINTIEEDLPDSIEKLDYEIANFRTAIKRGKHGLLGSPERKKAYDRLKALEDKKEELKKNVKKEENVTKVNNKRQIWEKEFKESDYILVSEMMGISNWLKNKYERYSIENDLRLRSYNSAKDFVITEEGETFLGVFKGLLITNKVLNYNTVKTLLDTTLSYFIEEMIIIEEVEEDQ